MLIINPDNIKHFAQQRAATFCLVVTPLLQGKITLASSHAYANTCIKVVTNAVDLHTILQEPALIDADFVFILMGVDNDVKWLTNNPLATQRFLQFSCSRTPIDLVMLAKFVDLLHRTNVMQQMEKAEVFFAKLEDARQLVFYDKRYDASATLDITTDLLWTEAYGPIKKGDRFLFPAGEIAISHSDFANANVPCMEGFNGELIWQGIPILSRHVPQLFMPPSEQARLFAALISLKQGAIKVVVKQGEITHLTLLDASVEPAYAMLNTLFAFDSRLRIINEIGLGLDDTVIPLAGNTVLNEAYSGQQAMCVHYGVGGHQMVLHLDVVVPDTVLKIQ